MPQLRKNNAVHASLPSIYHIVKEQSAIWRISPLFPRTSDDFSVCPEELDHVQLSGRTDWRWHRVVRSAAVDGGGYTQGPIPSQQPLSKKIHTGRSRKKTADFRDLITMHDAASVCSTVKSRKFFCVFQAMMSVYPCPSDRNRIWGMRGPLFTATRNGQQKAPFI